MVVARFLLFAFLLRKGDNFDTELYFLMCGVLVLAFPVFSILNPGILFETKSQVAVRRILCLFFIMNVLFVL